MHVLYRADGSDTLFVIAGLDEAYRDTVRRLGFEPLDGGFARRFPSDSPHLGRICANFARSVEEMILQRAGLRPIAWDRALDAILRLMDQHSIAHWLVGSAALAVRGLPVAPGDVDLVVDETGARRLAEVLSDDLIEPLMPVEGWGALALRRSARLRPRGGSPRLWPCWPRRLSAARRGRTTRRSPRREGRLHRL